LQIEFDNIAYAFICGAKTGWDEGLLFGIVLIIYMLK
jgi:tetrahydromethanopterin S-methyltransferase subunit G